MKSKINIEQICGTYNRVRENWVGKKLSNAKVIELLKAEGISTNMASRMVANSTLFEHSKMPNKGRGRHVAYTFSYNPVHIAFFRNWLTKPVKKESKENLTFEEECVKYLQKEGYKLRRCTGFDELRFKQDYPQLYEKYLKYEDID